MDKKPGHFPEIWLAIEVCIRALPIARAKPECRLKNPTEPTAVQYLLDLPVPGLETKIFVDDQPYPRGFGNARGFTRFVQRSAKRLLANHVGSSGRGRPDSRQMGFWRRDHIEQIGHDISQHERDIGMDLRNSKLG